MDDNKCKWQFHMQKNVTRFLPHFGMLSISFPCSIPHVYLFISLNVMEQLLVIIYHNIIMDSGHATHHYIFHNLSNSFKHLLKVYNIQLVLKVLLKHLWSKLKEMWLCVYVCLYCLKLEQKTANYNISLVESVYNMCVLEMGKVNLMKKNTFANAHSCIMR